MKWEVEMKYDYALESYVVRINSTAPLMKSKSADGLLIKVAKYIRGQGDRK